MAVVRGIQLRKPVAPGHELEYFEYNGKHYTITGISSYEDLIPDALPMGVWMTGFVRQYTAIEEETQKPCEVYVYFYRSNEGHFWAVIDAIKYI